MLVVDALDVLRVFRDPMIFRNSDADARCHAVSCNKAIHHLIWPHVLKNIAKYNYFSRVWGEIFFPGYLVSDIKYFIDKVWPIHSFIKCVKINIDDTLWVSIFQTCWIFIAPSIYNKSCTITNCP